MQQIYRRTSMPKCDFNKVALHSFATLLKSHFGMGVLLQICCIFSEDLFLRTPLGGCFCNCKVITNYCAKYVEIRHSLIRISLIRIRVLRFALLPYCWRFVPSKWQLVPISIDPSTLFGKILPSLSAFPLPHNRSKSVNFFWWEKTMSALFLLSSSH